jgi:hypothetical protein
VDLEVDDEREMIRCAACASIPRDAYAVHDDVVRHEDVIDP